MLVYYHYTVLLLKTAIFTAIFIGADRDKSYSFPAKTV